MFKSKFYYITDDDPELFFHSPNKTYKLMIDINGEVSYYKGKEKIWTSNTQRKKTDQYGNLEDIVVEFHPNSLIYVYYKKDKELIYSTATLDSLRTYHFPSTSDVNLQIYNSGTIKLGGDFHTSELPNYNWLREKLYEIGITISTVDDLKNLKISNQKLRDIM